MYFWTALIMQSPFKVKCIRNKWIFQILLFSGILLFDNDCKSSLYDDIQHKINTVAKKYVPDTKEGICSIQVIRGKKHSLMLMGETMFQEAREEIIAIARETGLTVIDSIQVLPDTILNKKYWGLITLSVSNIRKFPAHESEMTSQAILGTPVKLIKSKDGWIFIQTPDKYLGWTEETSVQLMDFNEMNNWRKANRIVFLENTGWIYGSTDKNSVISDIVAGSILEVTAEFSGYYKIVLPDGREGFISKHNALEWKDWVNQFNWSGANVCMIAETLLGIPYLWGGTSSKAVDCSGFVQSVYFRNGLILPRDASLQFNEGKEIDLSKGIDQLEMGDLLFFGIKDDSCIHVTHVAIYDDDSEFIHASGRVMINSLDSTRTNYDEYRKKSIIGVKRILNNTNPGSVSLMSHPWY
jgi:cell wall-associated NlpC family hydrolase